MSVGSDEKDLKKFALAIQALANGKSNAAGSITLKAGSASTVFTSADSFGINNVAPQRAIFLFPRTAHAAAELATGGCYVSSVGNQTFTVTHANNAQTDREFFYVALG